MGLSVSFSLSGLEFLGVRLGQRSRGNRFLSPGTLPCVQTAQLRRETRDGELSPGVPKTSHVVGAEGSLEMGVWGKGSASALEVQIPK